MNLLTLLGLPTMQGLLRQKRLRWVGHTLRAASWQRPLKGGGEKRVITEFKTMDKVPARTPRWCCRHRARNPPLYNPIPGVIWLHGCWALNRRRPKVSRILLLTASATL